MKHIESILPEYAADDMTALLLSDATATAALTRLLHNVTGCDIPQTSDLPESEVEELVPLCVSILRRHWQTPLTCLGDGTTPMSLSDLMRQAIGDRVQGNEAWAIPPANANIPTAVAALRQRDMSSGLTLTLTDGTDGSTDGSTTMPLPDGLSLAQLLCSGLADNVTEIKDSNTGWEWNHEFPLTNFPNLERISFNCISATKMSITGIVDVKLDFCKQIISNGKAIIWDIDGDEVMEFPELVTMEMNSNNALFGNFHKCKKLLLPKLSTISKVGNAHFCSDFPNLIELHAPNFSGQTLSSGAFPAMFIANPNLRWVRFGHFSTSGFAYGTLFEECPNLIKFEPKSIIYTLNVGAWNPTMALRTDTTAEDYVDLREDMSLANNLEQFLSNFQTYIADRVADRTGTTALTLTLSAAVYEALQAQEGQTILATLTNKNWTVAQA